MKKEVLVIFKTHLDIGFTDYSENVLERYLNEYIPNAIRVGNELKDTKTPFIWTVGSWLIWQALKRDTDGRVEQAIRDGILRWHALPFTSHTELMNRALFDYGVSLSSKLDQRFGLTTFGAKMTDVPGHTRSMIPVLKKHGVRFLHLGVNTATPVPPVPPLFRWRQGDDELLVMYQGDYGAECEFDDFVVCFAHTGDNLGPQSAQSIIEIYEDLARKYPDYTLKAATLNDLALKMETVKDVPVLEQEIGDTWIHGAGTDPQKVSRYRKLLRHVEAMGEIDVDLTDNLLCVPEHTWGMDVKTHFPYEEPFTHREMAEVLPQRVKIEKSWEEQRAYVTRAEALLGVPSDYPVKEYDLDGYSEIDVPSDCPYEISWQLFDNRDYMRYRTEYMRHNMPWAIWDFTKVGLKDYEGGIFTPQITRAFAKDGETLYRMEFDPSVAEEYGLPYFYMKVSGSDVEIKWFGKQASRLPQAFWFKIKGLEECWQINKIGEWIRADEIVGSPLICGVDKGVRNGAVQIECLDSALVAPYGRKLLHYLQSKGEQDLYFNLYNNIWNTNFPMWYSDDALFRFSIKRQDV